MIKRAIFDFDGTIADSKELGIRILNDLAPKYGYQKLPETGRHEYYHMSLKRRMDALGIGYRKLMPLSRDFIGEFARHAGAVEPIPGMVDIIRQIHARGIGITIISSNSKENIRIFLENHGLLFVDRIMGVRKLFGKEKYIRRELKELGLSPGEAIYIGDEARDVDACKKAEVRVIAVTWGFDSPRILKEAAPDFIATRPEELIELMA